MVMSKVLIVVCILLLHTVEAFDNANYKGWSIGIEGGYARVHNKIKWNKDKDKQSIAMLKAMGLKVAHKTYHNMELVGVNADYHQTLLKQIYLGAGIGLGTYFGKSKADLINWGFVGNKVKVTMSYKRSLFGNFTTRVGYNFNNKCILYGLGAVHITKVNYDFITDTDIPATGYKNYGQKKNSKWSIGFGIGAGVNFKLTKAVSAGVEYRYILEPKVKVVVDEDNDKLFTIKPRIHQIGLRINYHF